MRLTVRYFASIREALGAAESVEIAEGSTVGAVRDALIARGSAHAGALARGRALRSALNRCCATRRRPSPTAPSSRSSRR